MWVMVPEFPWTLVPFSVKPWIPGCHSLENCWPVVRMVNFEPANIQSCWCWHKAQPADQQLLGPEGVGEPGNV